MVLLAVPPKVENVKIARLENGKKINITWKIKDNNFDRPAITYTLEVYSCINQSICDDIAKNVKFSPNKTDLTTTYVVVSNLELEEKYRIKVISMSNLKNVPKDKWKFAQKTFPSPGLYYEHLFEKVVVYSILIKRFYQVVVPI